MQHCVVYCGVINLQWKHHAMQRVCYNCAMQTVRCYGGLAGGHMSLQGGSRREHQPIWPIRRHHHHHHHVHHHHHHLYHHHHHHHHHHRRHHQRHGTKKIFPQGQYFLIHSLGRVHAKLADCFGRWVLDNVQLLIGIYSEICTTLGYKPRELFCWVNKNQCSVWIFSYIHIN